MSPGLQLFTGNVSRQARQCLYVPSLVVVVSRLYSTLCGPSLSGSSSGACLGLFGSACLVLVFVAFSLPLSLPLYVLSKEQCLICSLAMDESFVI